MRALAIAPLLLAPVLLALVPTAAADECGGSQFEDTTCTVEDLRTNECQAINVFCQQARLENIVGGYLDRTCDRQLGPGLCNPFAHR